jgi:hypothetical protein
MIAVVFAVLGAIGAGGKANAGLYVSIGVAPPALPVYVQPPIPGSGYIWTPGYWAWDEEFSDYYWVPGAWVAAPRPGLLWTPGYWGWSNGAYVWNDGYWGPHVGFYGGVCYGFGYTGAGFAGGYWSGGSYYYNRSVTNIGKTTIVNNVYTKVVINNTVSNVAYNGGSGGIKATPSTQELQAANDKHIPPTKAQFDHVKLASQNKDLRASVNKGKPSIAAVAKTGDFSHPVAAKGAPGFVKPASLASTHVPDGRRIDPNHRLAKPKGPDGATSLSAAHQPINGALGSDSRLHGGHNAIPGPNKYGIATLNHGSADGRKNLGATQARSRNAQPKAAAKVVKPAHREHNKPTQ